MKKKSKLLYETNEWTVDSVEEAWKVIDDIGRNELGLDYYPPQIELITYDQMIEAYSSIGMPVMYNHWSFGKSFIATEQSYRAGQQGLAYELVINSDPAVAYLMETNTMTMQALVLAHACCGHVHFFKNNYLFKEWTDAKSIVPYLTYARDYIDKCSKKYGEYTVESLLDACHALQDYGVDTYKRGKKKTDEEYYQQELERLQFKQETYREEDEIYPGFHGKERTQTTTDFTLDLLFSFERVSKEPPRGYPEENILYFLEKRSPILLGWEKEIVRIVRNIAQYFYPQRQTKVMNEGFATAIHYTIMNRLYEKGCISSGNMLEFLHSHTNVCCQHDLSSMNPYTLGFSIFMDLKRMCEEPTDEDREYFPQIAGSKDWLSLWKDCVANYRDESFILQFLSPKVARDLKLMTINYDSTLIGRDKYYEVVATHTHEDFIKLRLNLANQHTLDYYRPNIQVTDVDWERRILFLRNFGSNNSNLETEEFRLLDDESTISVIDHITRLWGFRVYFGD